MSLWKDFPSCLRARVFVRLQLLSQATEAITEQHGAAEHDTHQLDRHTPPQRVEVRANETRRRRGSEMSACVSVWKSGQEWCHSQEGEIYPQGKMKETEHLANDAVEVARSATNTKHITIPTSV